MPHNISAGLITFFGFAAVAGCTWLLSYCPRLFFRLFARRDEFPEGIPTAWRNPGSAAVMRFIAALQLAAGVITAVLAAYIGRP